jgi:hypothetical protein
MLKQVLLAIFLTAFPIGLWAQTTPPFEMLTWVDNQWTVLDSNGQIVRTLSILPAEQPGLLSLSHDGSKLVFLNRNWQTWEYDFGTNTSRFLFQTNWNAASQWMPGSTTRVSFNDESGKLLTYDTTTGAQTVYQLNDTIGYRVLTRIKFDGDGTTAVMNIHYPGAGGMGVFIADVCHADLSHALCNIRPLAWPGNGSTSWSDVAANGVLTNDGTKAIYAERAPATNGSIFLHDIATNSRVRLLNWSSNTEVEADVHGLYADRYAVVRGMSKVLADHAAIFVCDIEALTCSEIYRHPGVYSLGSIVIARQIGGDTNPPVLTVPDDITVEAAGPLGAQVHFATSAIDDVDGVVPVTCTPPSGSTFALNTTSVACTAADAAGNMSNASFSVTVEDSTAPMITAGAASPDVLWPPNNKMIDVTLTVAAADAVSPTTCSVGSVASNEAIAADDRVITGPLSVRLRAQRFARPGRTYTITLSCSDQSGNASTTTTTVVVPHDQRP